MKRYKAKRVLDVVEDPGGDLVKYIDALEMMHVAIQFVMDHAEDIQNDVDDFGNLRPMLESFTNIEKRIKQ